MVRLLQITANILRIEFEGYFGRQDDFDRKYGIIAGLQRLRRQDSPCR